jgi:hypothetical protein
MVYVRMLPELVETRREGPTGDLSFIVGERGKPMTKEGCDPKWCNQAVRRSDFCGLLSLATAGLCWARAFQ